MKHVRLPIYDGELQIMQELHINIEYFTTGPGRNFGRVVDTSITPEQEVEMLDRIVHSLPTKPFKVHRAELLGEFPMPEKSEPYRPPYGMRPKETIEWRDIPGFSSYKMNNFREIVSIWDDMEVEIRNADRSKERQSVILWDGSRSVHMNLSHLFYKTFPELKK